MFVVTGASQNHFKSLYQFLNNININFPEFKNVIVYDLGLENNNINIIKNYFPNYIYKFFDYTKYPNFFNIKINAGQYAWKPACIYETYIELYNNNYRGTLLWCDSGNLFIDNMSKIYEIIKKQGIFSPTSSDTIKRWTHPKCLNFLDINEYDKMLSLSPRNGAILGFDLENKKVCDFIKKFYNLSLLKDCIAPEGSDRTNHRQDQSVFSILYYNFTNNNSLEENYISLSIHNDID
jgi:hypothetical protein